MNDKKTEYRISKTEKSIVQPINYNFVKTSYIFKTFKLSNSSCQLI